MTQARTTIEFPTAGKTYSRDEYGVYRYDEYPRGSVLEGQERRTNLGSYLTEAEARAAHPEAEPGVSGCQYREVFIPQTPPAWFDPMDAGEAWGEDDY